MPASLYLDTVVVLWSYSVINQITTNTVLLCMSFFFLHESSINVSVVIQLTYYCVIWWAKSGIKNFRLQHCRYRADNTLQNLQGMLWVFNTSWSGGGAESHLSKWYCGKPAIVFLWDTFLLKLCFVFVWKSETKAYLITVKIPIFNHGVYERWRYTFR